MFTAFEIDPSQSYATSQHTNRHPHGQKTALQNAQEHEEVPVQRLRAASDLCSSFSTAQDHDSLEQAFSSHNEAASRIPSFPNHIRYIKENKNSVYDDNIRPPSLPRSSTSGVQLPPSTPSEPVSSQSYYPHRQPATSEARLEPPRTAPQRSNEEPRLTEPTPQITMALPPRYLIPKSTSAAESAAYDALTTLNWEFRKIINDNCRICEKKREEQRKRLAGESMPYSYSKESQKRAIHFVF